MKRKSGPLVMRPLEEPLSCGSRTPLSLMKGSVSGFLPSYRDRTLQENTPSPRRRLQCRCGELGCGLCEADFGNVILAFLKRVNGASLCDVSPLFGGSHQRRV